MLVCEGADSVFASVGRFRFEVVAIFCGLPPPVFYLDMGGDGGQTSVVPHVCPTLSNV